MKIAINLMRFKDKSSGGNFVYAKNTIKSLVKILDENSIKIFCQYREITEDLFDLKEFSKIEYITVKGKNSFFDMHFFLSKLCYFNNIDIFFSPSHLLPFIKPKCKTMVTVHDLNFKHFSQGIFKDIYKNIIYKHTIDNADRIIAISEFTKNDILKNYKVNPNNIKVIYNGVDSVLLNDENKNTYGNYLLSIAHHKHKNPDFLIDVIATNKILFDDLKLRIIFVGLKQDAMNLLINKAKTLKVNDYCIFLGYIDEEKLNYLYKNALVFLFPSKFEGFGIPVIEAMNSGCPVISSAEGALPEVIKDAGLVIKEFNEEIWGKAILSLIKNKKLRYEIIKKGIKCAEFYNWEKCSIKLLNAMKELYNEDISYRS